MKSPVSMRLVLAVAALLGAVGVGLNLLLSGQPIDPTFPAITFPLDPALPGWQAVLEEPDPIRPRTQRYRRTGSDPVVALEMQFIPDLPVHYVRNPKIELRFLPRAHLPLDAGMRYYVSSRGKAVPNQHQGQADDLNVTPGPAGAGWWMADGTAHLSTVVTAWSDMSIVPRTLAQQMYLKHVTPRRLLRWLLAQEAFPDRRCVLIHLSAPAGPQAQAVLEQAWEEWRSRHLPVFPGVTR